MIGSKNSSVQVAVDWIDELKASTLSALARYWEAKEGGLSSPGYERSRARYERIAEALRVITRKSDAEVRWRVVSRVAEWQAKETLAEEIRAFQAASEILDGPPKVPPTEPLTPTERQEFITLRQQMEMLRGMVHVQPLKAIQWLSRDL